MMVTENIAAPLVQSVSPSMAPTNASGPVDTSSGQQKRPSDNRRSNKPIMEKRRRARINNCLNELKTLILDAMKKDPARHSKLEKADILEMTVKHLQNMQMQQQAAMSVASDPTAADKFRAGFGKCAAEVCRFPGLEPAVKRRLLLHLSKCQQGTQDVAPQQQQVQVHILPSSASPEMLMGQSQGPPTLLVPTRLSNGDIAFVLPRVATPPSTSGGSNNHVPLLVPIPTRTESTASASSSGSSSYPMAESPEPIYMKHSNIPMNPLSLVMRKAIAQDDVQLWRPW